MGSSMLNNSKNRQYKYSYVSQKENFLPAHIKIQKNDLIKNKENTTNASDEQPSCSKDSNKNDQILHIESKKRLSSDDLSTGTSAAPPVKKARKLPDWMLNMEDIGNENKSPVKVVFSDFNMRMGLIYFLNSLSFNTLGLDYEICWSQSFIKMLSDHL